MRLKISARLFICLLLSLALKSMGQTDYSGNGLSRSTEQAIRLYHEGQDNEAMDRFMDILVKGTPSEKSLANSYISRITLRMNTGIPSQKDPGTDGGVLKEVESAKQVQVRQQ